MNIWQKIWKYKFHYVVVIPALLLILYFKGIPLIIAFIMSFKEFQFFRGIADSPWVGWSHYAELWGNIEFSRVLTNTLILKLLYTVLSGLIALILALALSGIRSTRIRSLFQTIFLLPYFVPTLVIAYITMLLVSINESPLFRLETLVLAEPTLWAITVMIAEIVSTVGIPIMIAMAAIHASAAGTFLSRISSASRAILAFMLLQLSTLLSFDAELVQSMTNALVREVAETIDSYGYTTGYYMGQYSSAAALWVTQFIIQLILTILVYLLIRRWFLNDLFHRNVNGIEQSANSLKRGSVVGWAVALLYSIVALVPIYFLVLHPYIGPGEYNLVMGYPPIGLGRYLLYLFLTLSVVFVYMLMTVTLAYPLTVKDLPGRTLYKGYLLIILTAGTGGIHEFFLYHHLGMISTVFAPILSGMVSIIGVFVLKSIFNSKYARLKEQASEEGRGEMHSFFMLFIPKVWKPLIGLGVLHFVTIWNAYQPSIIYIAQPDRHTPLGSFFSLMMAGPQSGVTPMMILKIGLVVSLPALVLFLIFRRWMTSEVFVGEVRKL